MKCTSFHLFRNVWTYRELQLTSLVLIQLRREHQEGLYSRVVTNGNRKNALKRALEVLIKIVLAFTGFCYVSKYHNNSNPFKYIGTELKLARQNWTITKRRTRLFPGSSSLIMKKRYSNSLFHNIVSNFLFEVVKSSYLSKKKSYEGAYTRWGSL